MPYGHFGTSFAFILLWDTYMWAFKVEMENFSISKKFFKGQNLEIFKIFKDYLDSGCGAPGNFSIIFLHSLNVYIPRDTG